MMILFCMVKGVLSDEDDGKENVIVDFTTAGLFWIQRADEVDASLENKQVEIDIAGRSYAATYKKTGK